MCREGRGSWFNPVLKAIPPTYLQFPYHNLLLLFLSLTETNERPYVGALYIWRGLSVRIPGCLSPGQQEEGRWEWITTDPLKKRTPCECRGQGGTYLTQALQMDVDALHPSSGR